MSPWLRNTLFAIMLICCGIIGARVYLELRQPEAAPAAVAQVVQRPERLPEFALNDVWNESHSISEWSGKPLLLNFWATWCAPCRREMPLLQALHNERDDTGLAIVGIAIDRREDVQSYIAEAGISYPILSGEADAMAVADLFGLDGLGLPFSVLVGADGSVLTVHVGEVTRDQLAEMVRISKSVAAGELQIDAAKRALEVL